MFAYCSSETVIPSLVFTKAELVYALTFLLNEIPDTDNSTKIEMVELRHYLNQIKDNVRLALANGTIKQGMLLSGEKSTEDTPKVEKPPESPSIADLKRQFPTLSGEEIKEVLEQAKAEQKKREEEEQKKVPPPPPSFIAVNSPSIDTESITPPILSPKEEKDRENSRKFAQLLGGL